MITQNKRIIGILISIALLLLTPIVAMQFTNEVDWKLSDFVVMGILLLCTGLLCEFVMRKVKNSRNRLVICAVVLLAFFLVWAELAVGVSGTPLAGS